MQNHSSPHFRPSRLVEGLRRFGSDTRGSASVEFAVVMSGLIMVASAIAAFCLYLATSSEVQQLAADLSRQSLTYVDRGYEEAEICENLQTLYLPSLSEGLPLIQTDRVLAVTCQMESGGGTLRVYVSYDLAGTMAQRFGRLIQLDIPQMQRAAELVL